MKDLVHPQNDLGESCKKTARYSENSLLTKWGI